jgi:hypothetical protein
MTWKMTTFLFQPSVDGGDGSKALRRLNEQQQGPLYTVEQMYDHVTDVANSLDDGTTADEILIKLEKLG